MQPIALRWEMNLWQGKPVPRERGGRKRQKRKWGFPIFPPFAPILPFP